MRQVGRRNHNETNMRNPIAIVMAALASAGHTGSAAFGNPVDNPNPLGYRSRGKGRGEAGLKRRGSYRAQQREKLARRRAGSKH